MSGADVAPGWYSSLKHGGLLIAPSKIHGYFVDDLDPLPDEQIRNLRRGVVGVLSSQGGDLGALLDTVLEEVLGLDRAQWDKASEVGTEWSHRAITRENVKPRRIWIDPGGAVLPVFDVALGAGARDRERVRLGVGRGRRAVSRVIEWLRKADLKIALLTNGRQWRLIHAGADYDAWCEWDAALWFEEGEPGLQVEALRRLLGSKALRREEGQEHSPLVGAILASRKGQAELSTVLGERVRQAVELLIRASSDGLDPIDRAGAGGQVSRKDIYIAATRMVMRCVVVLFAEARDLLPRDNRVYHGSYGLQGLREQLDRRAGGHGAERLRHSYSAWPRLVALFRLVYHGSPHEALPIIRYGGGLFEPGSASSEDPILRALAVLESSANKPPDAVVHQILEKLTQSPVKVRQGNRNTWVMAPVDFSDLSTEYIGILYEGLLDFELRRAPDDDPMLFLKLGDQPALPLSRLEAMSDQEIADLVEKLGKPSRTSLQDDETGDESEDSEDLGAEEKDGESEEGEQYAAAPEDDDDLEHEPDDHRQALRDRAQAWAVRAVRAGKLVRKPRGQSREALDKYEQEAARTARGLLERVILPGDWFLVRWGGTRKGQGTFYTRPQLAGPTTRRTLRPLAYAPVQQHRDEETGLTTVTEWEPRTPEEILALKVCDPAMGSASFLVSALRFLTQALVESLHHYGRLEADGTRTVCKLADGLPANHPSQETLPVPLEHPEFDERLRGRLNRHIVERCLYGVDLDPLAVELARLSLWVETMDPTLPFGFLDHKLKCGNALVGCWFDRFQDYPVLAWEREGGDNNHERYVHHFREYEATRGTKRGETLQKGDRWTAAIKDFRNDVLKKELVAWAQAQEQVLPFMKEGVSPADVHDGALAVFERLHELPIHETDQRRELYEEMILGSPRLERLR